DYYCCSYTTSPTNWVF
nr:immunoglobulin light chain junction region [Macaca mulatta]MOV94690.1 immunoglobulin light chain junction region [Macaca mulatta]MOV94825.1 immunoglobulin light chain junction region [Macaca mulatta]MOV94832.1 immunoglobulin light chain junction region [Macaca mulatta]MOV95140.1 immunoglobulin light chain junction region [Macaca mulatta]